MSLRNGIARVLRLQRKALALSDDGRFDRAESAYLTALDVLQAAAGKDNPDYANLLNLLAETRQEAGRVDEAEAAFRESLGIARRYASGEPGGVKLHALLGLGHVYLARGEYVRAEPVGKQAVRLAERIFGPDHPEVSAALNSLAVLYKYMARFVDAGRLYQRALAISEQALGPDHPDVATIYHNLGGLEHAAGNFERGEPFARRAVEIRRRALGPDHPDVAIDMAALAPILDGLGRRREAEALLRRVLEIFERVYGPEHYEIAVNLNNLAAVCHGTGNHAEAERLYRRALAIKQKLLGPGHPDVALTLNNLGVFMKSRRKYADAEALYVRALDVFRKTLDADHPKLATCLENYAGLLRKIGRRTEARRLQREADCIRKRSATLDDDGLGFTGTIDPRHACFPLEVRPSAIHRLGVFAGAPIPAGRKVIEYTGRRIGRREADHRAGRSLRYMFNIDRHGSLDGAVGGSGAELINHSCDPNLYSRLNGGHILYMSKRAIAAGEELTVDYRFSWDVPAVPCRCGSANCRGTINRNKPDVSPRAVA